MDRKAPLFTPVLIASCIILVVSFGVRSSFGVFQIPIAAEFGWLRTEFSLAIAIQNLAWGIGQPIFGAISEKIGDRKAIAAGTVLYALGLVLSAYSVTPLGHQTYAWMVGFGVAGTGFGVILAIVARSVSDENRSMAMAIAAAMGSVGQIVGPPGAQWLLSIVTWQTTFLIFAGMVMTLLLVLPMIGASKSAGKDEVDQRLSDVLAHAFRDRSYLLIILGFFSCGYQVAFLTAHFPALVTEMSSPIAADGLLARIGLTSSSAVGAAALSLVGAANIVGTLIAGWLGNRYSRKYLLAGIYAGRTVLSVLFILLPITPLTVLLFSGLMGLIWLASIPLTSGLVGYIYGLRYMGTLYGFVFLSHQLGGFLGVWLGGVLYDANGDYTLVWWIGIGVSALSAIVHLPIRERPVDPVEQAA